MSAEPTLRPRRRLRTARGVSGVAAGSFKTLASLLGQHVLLVAVSTIAAVLIAVPLGIFASRRPRLAAPLTAIANIVQTALVDMKEVPPNLGDAIHALEEAVGDGERADGGDQREEQAPRRRALLVVPADPEAVAVSLEALRALQEQNDLMRMELAALKNRASPPVSKKMSLEETLSDYRKLAKKSYVKTVMGHGTSANVEPDDENIVWLKEDADGYLWAHIAVRINPLPVDAEKPRIIKDWDPAKRKYAGQRAHRDRVLGETQINATEVPVTIKSPTGANFDFIDKMSFSVAADGLRNG